MLASLARAAARQGQRTISRSAVTASLARQPASPRLVSTATLASALPRAGNGEDRQAGAFRSQLPTPQSYRTMSSASGTGPSRSLATVATADHSPAHSTSSAPLESLPEGYEIKTTIGNGAAAAPYAVFTRPLETSMLDDRTYRLIRLSNGLEALVIHDPEADKASAAMDIRVGHLSDPIELQGLAHFCEHLLFMGTQKYPRENEYSEFLSNHSGGSNAYTGMDNTNYFFDVGYKHLEGALDRFAQFFLQPLFDPSCTEREIRAVDSEHKKNLQSDAWRAFQLDKSLSDPSHPYSHFGTGNAKTLWDEPRARGMDVRDELLKFHDRHYSANVMKLVVLGREDVDKLTQMVVDKFSGVRNKALAAPSFPASPLGPEQLQRQIFFRSVKDIRMLEMSFPIPDQTPLFMSKPGQIISHFIGHEGQGSILSYLKGRGWANHLSAGAMNGAEGFEFFKISLDLTSDGLKHYDEVVAAIFRYIDLLKSAPIPEWSYKEVKQLSELAFRFREKMPASSYTSGLSTQMQMPYPREWVMSGPFLTREFNMERISEIASKLSPSNCRVSIAAQAMPDGTKDWDMKEQWYGTEYKVAPLAQKVIESSSRSIRESEEMFLPKPNDFIPSSFAVPGAPEKGAEKPRPTKRPVLVQNTPSARLWHKKDDRFFLPKANIHLLLRNPLIDATPNNAVKARMFVELLKDALTEYSYDAELAGLAYNIEANGDTIGISIDGYNDKLSVLLGYIVEQMKNFQVSPERFDIIKDSVKRGYENFRLEAPYLHANYYTSYLTVERLWTANEKLAEIEHLTADAVSRFQTDILDRMHIEMLAHGNISRDESKVLLGNVEKVLDFRALSPSELISARSLLIEPKTNYRFNIAVPNAENVNSSVEHYVQIDEPLNVHRRATLALFAQIANEPAFDQLRTKEQLGYLVFSGTRKTIGNTGFRIIVQSERSSDYLESRIEEFYRTTMRNVLDKMTADEFEAQRESLIRKRMETVKNLYDESGRFWWHIHSGYYDFLQRDEDIKALCKITKDDVVRLFERYISPDSAEGRSKLVTHVQSQVKVPRFATKAVDELAKACEAKGWTDVVSAEALQKLKTQEPSVEAVKTELVKADAPNAADLGKLIDELAAKHPYTVDESTLVKRNPNERDVVVDDAIAFKSSLRPGCAAVPVRTFAELSTEASPDEGVQGDDVASLLSKETKRLSANL